MKIACVDGPLEGQEVNIPDNQIYTRFPNGECTEEYRLARVTKFGKDGKSELVLLHHATYENPV